MIRGLIGVGVAVGLHLVLGWAWTIGGGIAVGLYHTRRAWLAGGICVGVSWSIFVAHAFIIAPEPTMRLMAVMGGIFGDLPSSLIPVLTVFLGILLGIAGGAVGASLKSVLTSLRLK